MIGPTSPHRRKDRTVNGPLVHVVGRAEHRVVRKVGRQPDAGGEARMQPPQRRVVRPRQHERGVRRVADRRIPGAIVGRDAGGRGWADEERHGSANHETLISRAMVAEVPLTGLSLRSRTSTLSYINLWNKVYV